MFIIRGWFFKQEDDFKNHLLIIKNHPLIDKKNGPLIYVSGEIISYNLDKDLISEGYLVTRLVNYTVKPIKEIKEKPRIFVI